MKTDQFDQFVAPPPFSNLNVDDKAKIVGTKEGSSSSKTAASETDMTNLQKVLDSNKKWVERRTTGEPDFFLKH